MTIMADRLGRSGWGLRFKQEGPMTRQALPVIIPGTGLVRGGPPGARAKTGGSSMFGTIVVAVDGSGPAGRAVETAAKIAAGTKDEVVVFHGVVVYHSWGKDVPA
jgi:hypothetical protein